MTTTPDTVAVPVDLLKALKAMAEGAATDIHDDRYIRIENPNASNPWDDPYLVIDISRLAARPAATPGGEITDQMILDAATTIRESSVAWADEPDEFAHLIELTPAEVRTLLAALSRPAPDGGA